MRIFLFLTGLCLLVTCGRKGEQEQTWKQDEAMGSSVTLPGFGWEKSITISFTGGVEADVVSGQVIAGLGKTGNIYAFDRRTSGIRPLVADFQLNGSVKKQGDSFEIVALVTDQKEQIFSDQHYQENEAGLLNVAQEITTRTVQTLSPETSGKPSSKPQTQAEVVTDYWQASRLMALNTHAATNEAVSLFKRTLKNDSTFTPAWMGLAEAYLNIPKMGWNHSRTWITLAQKCLLKASETDPENGQIYRLLGEVYLGWGDLSSAEKSFRHALNLNPFQDQAWTGLGRIYSQYGLYAPALKTYDHSLELKPDQPDVTVSYALLLIGSRQYEQAETRLQKQIDLNAGDDYLLTFLALAQFYRGNYENALASVETGLQASEYQVLAHAVNAMILAASGNPDAALGEAELEVKPSVRGNASLAVALAADYALLGRAGTAVNWLKKALESGYADYVWISNDPNFDSLRQNSEFMDIAEQIKNRWEAAKKAYFHSEENREPQNPDSKNTI